MTEKTSRAEIWACTGTFCSSTDSVLMFFSCIFQGHLIKTVSSISQTVPKATVAEHERPAMGASKGKWSHLAGGQQPQRDSATLILIDLSLGPVGKTFIDSTLLVIPHV